MRRRAPSATTCQNCGATNYHDEETHGGGFVDELGKLAIPLGLIAAKEGVASFYNSKKKTATKASPPKPKKKAQALRRRGAAAFGGGNAEEADAFFGGWDAEETPVTVTGGRGGLSRRSTRARAGQWGGTNDNYATEGNATEGNATVTDAAEPPAVVQEGQLADVITGNSEGNSLSKSDGKELQSGTPGNPPPLGQYDIACTPVTKAVQMNCKQIPRNTMTGGAAAQHAMIAQEFRRMAAEIGSFLEKKSKGVPAPKKPEAKKPTKAAAAKKPAAKKVAAEKDAKKPKKAKAAAAPKKKKAESYAGFW